MQDVPGEVRTEMDKDGVTGNGRAIAWRRDYLNICDFAVEGSPMSKTLISLYKQKMEYGMHGN